MLLEDRTEATRPQQRIPCQKGWRGMWSPHGLGMGGRMDQLIVQVDEGGSRPCGVEGESLVEVWRRWEGADCSGTRPFGGGCAPVAYLIGRGLEPFQEVW